MAVGTVSGIEQENNWQLISTNTPTSGTATTFTSISGYKRLMVVWKALTTGTSQWLYLKVNDNTTAGNYASHTGYPGVNDNSASTTIILNGHTRAINSGMLIIENANQSTPHETSLSIDYGYSYADPSILLADPITRVDIWISASSFTGGTVQLWGIAG
jgi:hypothetical protein